MYKCIIYVFIRSCLHPIMRRQLTVKFGLQDNEIDEQSSHCSGLSLSIQGGSSKMLKKKQLLNNIV